jgi:hypothetical protein
VSENGISQFVIDFLNEQIDSVLELEVLLLVRESAPRQWTAADLSIALKIDSTWAAAELEKFGARQILARGDNSAYFYAPANESLDATIKSVAHAYATHRVRIIGLIFSKPTSTLKSFADAFRIRKEKE